MASARSWSARQPTLRSMAASKDLSFDVKPFDLHKCDGPDTYSVETTSDDLLSYYRTMQTIRRIEVASDNLYKEKLIKGFLHLYNGQEAVCTGIEGSITLEDHVITAYRCHGWALTRGDTPAKILCELIGKAPGSAAGKGGSMHMYNAENNFHGGNGIVGAHVPVGAGVAWAQALQGKDNVCIAAYGDGAANQGQIFEAFNMAALWNIPAVFVIENNHFGMGTASNRAAGSTAFFERGDFLPGIRVDGMDVLAVKHSMDYATSLARQGQAVLVEYDTYRYVGHSMSDPGTSYRTKDDVKKVRESRDPILRLKARIVENEIATEAEMKAIDKEIRKEVDAAVQFARDAPWPDLKETYTHVYTEPTPIRANELSQTYQP